MTRTTRGIVIGVGAIAWAGLTYAYAHWAATTAHDYWAAPPGTSHSLVVLLLATVPTSIIGFIPMYLYAANAWSGGSIEVAHAMSGWFAITAVINSVVLVALIFGTTRALAAAKRRRTRVVEPEALVANPYLT